MPIHSFENLFIFAGGQKVTYSCNWLSTCFLYVIYW